MFLLHMDSSQEQSRASCLGWGCWGLPGSFPVAHAFAFNLCLLQNHGVECFQHGGLVNSTSAEALHPVTLLSWTFLCITGYRQPPWCLPTYQMPVMHTQLWPIPSDLTYHPVGVRIIGVIQCLCLAVVSSASCRTNFSCDPAALCKNRGPILDAQLGVYSHIHVARQHRTDGYEPMWPEAFQHCPSLTSSCSAGDVVFTFFK